MNNWKVLLARLMMIAAFACGVVGLIIGLVDREWKLGVTGWFTGGILLGVLAIMVLVDDYFAARQKGRGP